MSKIPCFFSMSQNVFLTHSKFRGAILWGDRKLNKSRKMMIHIVNRLCKEIKPIYKAL